MRKTEKNVLRKKNLTSEFLKDYFENTDHIKHIKNSALALLQVFKQDILYSLKTN